MHTALRRLSLALVPLTLIACSSGGGESADDPGDGAGAGGGTSGVEDPVAHMNAAIAELMARPEHDPSLTIEVDHILISWADVPNMPADRVVKTKAEAEARAADLFVQLQQGASFRDLKERHTADNSPAAPPTYELKGRQSRFVEGFKKVGWRMEVGELGVSPYDPSDSPYGWHIIRRVK